MNPIIARLEQTIAARKDVSGEHSYVASLHAKGLDAILKKVSEEATESILAAKNGDHRQTVRETADLVFHLLVMLGHAGIRFDEVLAELERREGVSGHTEKAARSQ